MSINKIDEIYGEEYLRVYYRLIRITKKGNEAALSREEYHEAKANAVRSKPSSISWGSKSLEDIAGGWCHRVGGLVNEEPLGSFW
jgi:hypothetical protein